jgi:hypothetical protein
MVASSLGWILTVTWCDPSVLIGVAMAILRLSSIGPPAVLTALAMSDEAQPLDSGSSYTSTGRSG